MGVMLDSEIKRLSMVITSGSTPDASINRFTFVNPNRVTYIPVFQVGFLM